MKMLFTPLQCWLIEHAQDYSMRGINETRVNKQWPNFHFGINCSFKTHSSDHLLSIHHTNKLVHTSEGELTSAWQGNLKMSLNIIQKGNQLCACFLLFRRWKNTWANQPSDSSWRDTMWHKGKNPASSVAGVLHSGHHFSLQEITDFIHEGCRIVFSYLLLFSSQCLCELYQFHSNLNRTESGFMLCFE